MFNIFNKGQKIKGTVVLMAKNVLDFDAITSIGSGGVTGAVDSIFDTATSLAGQLLDSATAIFSRSVSLQLISATKTDGSGNGKLGTETFLQKHIPTLPTLGARKDVFEIYFDWDSDFGIPGAFYIKNFMQDEFFIVSVTLEDIPNHGTIYFVCNSWVYNAKYYKKERIFFDNNAYLPNETPAPLAKYRAEELQNLRGDGTGERKVWERIYDYDVYNDLGNPDSSENLARPVLGGSSTYPYPRRVRTGRKPTRKDPKSEQPGEIYVPRDENFGHLKSSDFLAYGIKSLSQDVLPLFQSLIFDLNFTPNEFTSFDDVRGLYEGGITLPTTILSQISPLPVLQEIFRTDGEQALKFPPPQVIKVSKSAWMTDDEFSREMIAGVNPCVIRLLEEFPPVSKLDATVYGDQTSTITKENLETNLNGVTIDEALSGLRLFILDYHDAFMPYLRRINTTAKAYATRTILFLKDDGTLKPLAIELSLPHPNGDQFGAVSKVILPADEGVESTIWLLAKAYVVVNDSCYHQLMSHWLNTHAVVEPFSIATNRNLSVLHPIYKLLYPHYRDTININGLARQSLINAGGIIEQSFLPGPYSIEMSSVAYKNWVFTDQALPADLIKRGLAVEDPSSPHGLRLVIEDYPYAVDGLEIWDAIKTWVQDYVSLYYTTDVAVQNDTELQAWWKEAVEKGHADLKDKSWWPKLQTREELIQSCSIVIWTASALHAAVNFGQYPYGGYILNRPTLSRRLIPEKGTPEYDEMVKSPQKAYLRTITPKYQTLVDLSVIEILSRHASDEIYLGERDNPNWTSDTTALQAFKKFGSKLAEIEGNITGRNNNSSLINRLGPVQLPYTLLLPTSNEGLTFRGIPNTKMFGILNKGQKVKGTVVFMPKNVLDFNAITSVASGGVTGAVGGIFGMASGVAGQVVDGATSIFSRSVSLQLISATKTDASGKGKIGKETFLQKHLPTLPTLGAGQDAFDIFFDWDADFGIPGAFYIKNYMQGGEFFLVSVTLEDIPNHGTIHFVCNSWVYNSKNYKKDRIFFDSNAFLPSETPAALVKYREEELQNLRGDGTGVRKEWERIYDYDVYNDLGNPDSGDKLARPILGGSSTYPYPRRVRTGRKFTRKDPKSEQPGTVYVPRDENFGHLKSSDFLTYGIKSLSQNVLPLFQSVIFDLNFTPNEFDSFDEVRGLYEGGIKLPTDVLSQISPLPVLKEIFRTDGEQVLKFPPPHVIKVTKSAWMTDEEFGREMLAGVNPCVIQLLQEFPPRSQLDATVYGDQTSTITKENLETNLDGVTVEEALSGQRLLILDYHDAFMPYLRKINTIAKAYATRTILFLKDDGTLKPLAIELSLPHPDGDQFGADSKVILPADQGVESTIWLLAKAHVIVNDSCYHQLMSHWLNTHAVVEPFIIATNRHLSVLHPIHKLLFPHYRDTININGLARNSLINAGGIIEQSFLPGPYSVEMSSTVYKNWVFTDQALPADLIKRGLAVEDPSSPHGLRLVIEDYPYAVDGLEIWDAIKTWVQDYVSLYYTTDVAVQKDSELQAWWKEAVEKGHADLKDKPWWPKLQTLEELIQSCSIIIWTASALHAAVNFGQYPYGGYILNRPTITRRFIPEKGTPEYDEMVKSPQKAYLRTITPKYQTLVDLSVIEILSRHASDEVYLGERDNPNWTSDTKALQAFKKFGSKLAEIEGKIKGRNNNSSLRNRYGPIQLPYTLLAPSSDEGLTFRGIPNSISI
ncbi:uncharacterized protein LOC133304241 [Gastrolobium bilobum]|uniref:uncharacterized protein LOC133304241 n=1 Tax=Gastrolobium bilobum TaxID=150636 RepID=UPI002AAF8380|nr:uncharacterized protein LOC133304241 [Gastrolobium bilobum]